MSHFTLSVRPSTGGLRKFAVLTKEAAQKSHWSSNRDISSQDHQSWAAAVWQRIAGRGYVCRLAGGGQRANPGDYGRYLGIGATAEAAILDAWGRSEGSGYDDRDIPTDLIAPMRDFDATVNPVAVE